MIERFYGLAPDGPVVLLAEFGYETVVLGKVTARELPTPPRLPDLRQRNTLHTYGPAAGNDGWGGNLQQRARSVPNQHGWPVHRSGRGECLIAPFQFRRPFAINSSGDIVFLYGEDSIREGYDVTGHIPEPSTLVLLAAGVLGAAGALRRRFVAVGGNG